MGLTERSQGHVNTNCPSALVFKLSLAQMVKNLPAVQETQVRSLGREDAWEKGMAAYSSILDRRVPWTEEPGGLQSTGSQRVEETEGLNT